MPTYALTNISDDVLLADLAALVALDRQTTAALLAHLAEVDARELFRPAACASMHVYCVRVLRFAEEVAFKRIRAARAARQYPQIFEAVADGRLNLTGIVLLAPHLTDENADELLATAAHKSKAEIEVLVARVAPRPDLKEGITPITLPTPGGLQLDPDPARASAPAPEPAPRVTPLAPERFALQLTISQTTRDKLDRAQALLRHRNPSGDLAEVIDRALDALLAKLEREKFGATARPRATKARHKDADPRYVSNEVRRLVHERDGEQCTFVSESGERCTERGFLELDHRTLVAHGGRPTVDNLSMVCRAHNQYLAELALGADFMKRKRTAARRGAASAITTVVSTVPVLSVTAALPSAAPELPAPAATDLAASPELPVTAAVRAEPERTSTPSAAATSFDAAVTRALRDLGFKSEETRRAVAVTAHQSATTFEARFRAALIAVTRSRCEDGPFDATAGALASVVACG